MSINKFILKISLVLVSFSAIADEGSSKTAHNWRGFYAGGFMGGTVSSTSDALLCVAGRTGIPCNSSDYNGYIEDRDLDDEARSSQSLIGGAQIGYNWQFEYPQGYNWLPNVWGVEAEYGHLNYKESIAGLSQIRAYAYPTGESGVDYDYMTSLKNYGFLGGRIGYAVDRALIYFKGGVVFTDMKTKFCSGPDRTCAFDRPGTNGKSTGLGYALGGGVEYALPWGESDKWSIKAEYLMMNLPSLGTASVGTLYGVPPEVYPLGFAINQKMDNFQTGKIAINYHF